MLTASRIEALLLLLILFSPARLHLWAADREIASPCSPVEIRRPPASIEVRCDGHELWRLRVAGAGTYGFAPPVLPLTSGPVSVAFGPGRLSVQSDDEVFAVSGHLQALPDLTLRIL